MLFRSVQPPLWLERNRCGGIRMGEGARESFWFVRCNNLPPFAHPLPTHMIFSGHSFLARNCATCDNSMLVYVLTGALLSLYAGLFDVPEKNKNKKKTRKISVGHGLYQRTNRSARRPFPKILQPVSFSCTHANLNSRLLPSCQSRNAKGSPRDRQTAVFEI